MKEKKATAFPVIDSRNVRGTIDLTVAPPAGTNSRLVAVRFENGAQIFADPESFVEREPGVYYFSGSFEELTAPQNAPAASGAAAVKDEQMVIPVLTEELNVHRERVLTGGVRVHKTVTERTETVNEPVLEEQVDVERVPVNQVVAEAPPVRYEGDTIVVPLLEEVMVVEKRLVLREEIRITKRSERVEKPQEVVLRSEQAKLERIVPENDSNGNPPVNRTRIRES
jgi:uncharacterized protein (TIGR02271 family)